MDFTSLDQLSSYLSSQAGQSMVLSNGMSIEEMLKTEAKRLLDCIQRRLDSYYDSYNPVMYERTYGLQKSMSVSDFISVNIANGTASITIDFDQADIQAKSLFGSGWDGYNKVELINNGWQVKDDVWFADIEHFGKFSGSHFIENGIADFNQSNPYNLKIELKGFHNQI
jgi:hypothetical protein